MRKLILSVFMLSCFSLHAQNIVELSLDSAVNYAVEHNKTLNNSRYAIDKSSQKIKETISQGLPQISASVDYTNFLGAEASLQMGPSSAPPISIEFNPTSNFKASASQLIFNGNYIVGIQLSKLAKKITEQSYQKDELNVKEQTIQAYYMVLATEQILNKLKENFKNAQSIYENTNNLAKVGMIEETDAKKLSVMVSSVSNAVKSTERQVELGYNLLRFQLGLESNRQIKLTTTLDDIVKKVQINNIIVDTFNIENNIDYKLVSMQGDIAKKSIDMAKANYLPSLVAIYSYTKKIKKPHFDMSPKHVLGVTLNIPIFAGGLRKSQLSQAKIDFDISKNTKDLLTDQLTIQEKQLRYNYKNLLEQYFSQKDNVDISKEVLDQMKLKFKQGIVSSLDLTSANNDYLTAETELTGTILKLLNAELALKKLNNKL
ncbi:MAG: TolC family protein [Bacteroidales bacterium]|nr:TolC family protein [Bacteroidales bacterium]